MNATGLHRNALDKFYTKPDIVRQCIEMVSQYIQIRPADLLIEPSAGDGSFIQGMRGLSPNCAFYDISPANSEITQLDFLEYANSSHENISQTIHVIGNPPFGRQSSLAIKFIKKAASFAQTISFILPKSFKKESMRNKIPETYHLICETDLPKNSFTIEGKDTDVPCVFQIWEKRETKRVAIPTDIPSGFRFVVKTIPHDISVRRVGVNAGVIDTNTIDKSIQSHYFIQFTNGKNISDNIQSIQSIKYETNNTVGPRSISKPEVIRAFNEALQTNIE